MGISDCLAALMVRDARRGALLAMRAGECLPLGIV
jgi:hypothetical protein